MATPASLAKEMLASVDRTRSIHPPSTTLATSIPLSQTAFYFLYMADVAFAAFLMMGAIGFYSSFAFVRYIYGSIKTD